VTIIRMTTGLDAGDMLAQEAIDILPDETAGELEGRLAPVGARLALKVIDQLVAGTAQGTKDKTQVTKAPKLKKEDGLIVWSQDSVIYKVRAMQPWPTAYTYFHRAGKSPVRVIINRVDEYMVCPLGHPEPQPGTIDLEFAEPGRLVVWQGWLLVEILELQPAGKKRMTAAEFLRGHPIQPGDHFGPESA
jgi:methionyl-tRNA formyltransferase